MIPGRPQGTRFSESFSCAWSGVRRSAKGRNFKVQLCLAGVAVALGAALGISVGEWTAVVVCIGAVLGAECLNTALEDAVDLASPELHPLAKTAKDAAAGGVLLLSITSLAVGGLVFLPKACAVFGLMG